MQSINQPQAALLAGMQPGQVQNPMIQQGFRGGGLASLRPTYRGGGSIGGGIIHGTPMGSRTGYWNPFKKAKKAVKKVFKPVKKFAQKLVPKELAPAMTWAAPFMGPIAGPVMAGLGSLKMHGKLDPRIMAMSMLPHMRFGMPQSMGGSGMGYGKWGGGNSLRRLLTGKGVGDAKGILNTRFGDFGTQLDENLFGSQGKWINEGPAGMERTFIPGKKGMFMDLRGGALEPGQGSFGEIFETLSKARGGGTKGKFEVVSSILAASSSYAEALEMANRAGVGDAMPGSEAEYEYWRDKIGGETAGWAEGTIYEGEGNAMGGLPRTRYSHGSMNEELHKSYVKAIASGQFNGSFDDFLDYIDQMRDEAKTDGNAMGGLPRTRYAMGSAQFPPQKRTGLKWGSDQGEGLGGEEVEADMRYTGGFMPYGEEPKADDVPARLSKDEFVFTDQAVAGAGDGDVELGAERLYNVMKNLEQGGRLSEESEGMGQGIGAIV